MVTEEILEAAKIITENNASSLDSIPNKFLKASVIVALKILYREFTGCFKEIEASTRYQTNQVLGEPS